MTTFINVFHVTVTGSILYKLLFTGVQLQMRYSPVSKQFVVVAVYSNTLFVAIYGRQPFHTLC